MSFSFINTLDYSNIALVHQSGNGIITFTPCRIAGPDLYVEGNLTAATGTLGAKISAITPAAYNLEKAWPASVYRLMQDNFPNDDQNLTLFFIKEIKAALFSRISASLPPKKKVKTFSLRIPEVIMREIFAGIQFRCRQEDLSVGSMGIPASSHRQLHWTTAVCHCREVRRR